MRGRVIVLLIALMCSEKQTVWAEVLVPAETVKTDDPAMTAEQVADQQAGIAQLQQEMAVKAAAMAGNGHLVSISPKDWTLEGLSPSSIPEGYPVPPEDPPQPNPPPPERKIPPGPFYLRDGTVIV